VCAARPLPPLPAALYEARSAIAGRIMRAGRRKGAQRPCRPDRSTLSTTGERASFNRPHIGESDRLVVRPLLQVIAVMACRSGAQVTSLTCVAFCRGP
jgi:hypothetical protein